MLSGEQHHKNVELIYNFLEQATLEGAGPNKVETIPNLANALLEACISIERRDGVVEVLNEFIQRVTTKKATREELAVLPEVASLLFKEFDPV